MSTGGSLCSNQCVYLHKQRWMQCPLYIQDVWYLWCCIYTMHASLPACFSILVVPACGNSTSEGGKGEGKSGWREGDIESRREVFKCDGNISSWPESSSAPLKGGNQESVSIMFLVPDNSYLSAIQRNTLLFFAENVIYSCKLSVCMQTCLRTKSVWIVFIPPVLVNQWIVYGN